MGQRRLSRVERIALKSALESPFAQFTADGVLRQTSDLGQLAVAHQLVVVLDVAVWIADWIHHAG